MDGPDDGVQRLCCGTWSDQPHATGCSLSMADRRDALQSAWAQFENSNALKHATGWEFAKTAFIAGYAAAERRADALAKALAYYADPSRWGDAHDPNIGDVDWFNSDEEEPFRRAADALAAQAMGEPR